MGPWDWQDFWQWHWQLAPDGAVGIGIGIEIEVGWPPHCHFDRSEAEWRNLPAEWGWWLVSSS